jgi:hypothetical protein
VIAGLLLLAEIEYVSGNPDLARRLFAFITSKKTELSLSFQEPDQTSLTRLNRYFPESVPAGSPSINMPDIEEILFGSGSI